MLLVIDTKRRRGVCVCVYICVCNIFVRYVKHGITAHIGVEVHGDARVEALAIGSCAAVNFASKVKMNRLVQMVFGGGGGVGVGGGGGGSFLPVQRTVQRTAPGLY